MQPLWVPSQERIKNANITRFTDFVNKKYAVNVGDFEALYQWSVEKREDFWAAIWEFGEVIASQPYEKVLIDSP